MNLLDTPLISTDPHARHSLPGLLAAMVRDEVRGFPRLRPHQRGAWHMFLVQLAVLALDRAEIDAAPEDEATWRAALLALTGGDEGAWALVGPPERPAFLQPAEVAGLDWKAVPTPDALDLLITAKNHDLKQQVAREAQPEDWVFALVSLQTGEGYGGRSNYGIARMNGGSSSRPLIGLAPASGRDVDPDPSAWFRRDAFALAKLRRETNEPPFGTIGGPALLWCLTWPEGPGLQPHRIDPLFIEVCRRVRLVATPSGLAARRAGSAKARLDADGLKGIPGDPWAPFHAKDERALTLSEHGDFGYAKVVELLTEWHAPPLARADEGDASVLLVLEALARGNSKTAGHKRRSIPIPGKLRNRLRSPDAGELAKRQIDEIAACQGALEQGLSLVAARGDGERRKKEHYRHAYAARARLDARADTLFFPALWERLAARQAGDTEAGEAARLCFLTSMRNAAREEFEAALPAIPCPAIHRPRAEARARRAFDTALWRSNELAPLYPREAADA